MFRYSESELDDGCEENPAEVGFCEFVVTRGDSTKRLEMGKAIFDEMPFAISSLAIGQRIGPVAFGWNAGGDALFVKPDAQVIAVRPFVRDDHLRWQRRHLRQNLRCTRNVGHISGTQKKCPRNAVSVHRRMDLGVPTPFGQPQSLGFASTGRIQPAAMDFDMRGVEIDHLGWRVWGDALPEARPKLLATPTSIVLVNGVPTRPGLVDASPGAAFAEHI